jgi:cytochrome oxidase Cu insertion factor (SCO1/SenC/PrrC family)
MRRGSNVRLVLAAALLAGCSDTRAGSGGALAPGATTSPEAEDPAAFGAVPPFELVSQTGAPVGASDLAGRPFVAAAIFTTCYGPCPRITRGMGWLQDELAGTDVRLVSISVDPERDTPEVLAAYAEAAGADEERWLFLTGARDEVERVLREGFLLGVERASADEAVVGGAITHSTRLVAVDAGGRLRGWYDGEDELELERLRERMLFLAREAP